ncbi:dephospho-CoA kinase [Corynebacterium durum]|uniref:dephospho-CoA kinase n=1 Tax=Corynebacterium durum TaxID=61592 RepID=UPI0028E33008|nr:dephospho-CoA kinase [Corynebacterium durum]
MLLIGLTGGIGSGKSTVAAMLRDQGIRVVDADQIAREVVEPGQPALAELVEVFGQDILNDDGSLNRQELANRAFATEEATNALNTITHPRIEEETQRQFDLAAAEKENFLVYDMPLLVERGLHEEMDMVIVVHTDIEERVRRLVEHRGLDEDDVRRRMSHQVDDVTRLASADVLIDNNGSVDHLRKQVDDFLATL